MAVPSIISQILAVFSGWGDYFFQREKNKVDPVIIRQRDQQAKTDAKNQNRLDMQTGDTQVITADADKVIDTPDTTIPGFQEQHMAHEKATKENDVKKKTDDLKSMIGLVFLVFVLACGCQSVTPKPVAPSTTWSVAIMTWDGQAWQGMPVEPRKGDKFIAVPDYVWSKVEDNLTEFKLLKEQGRILR